MRSIAILLLSVIPLMPQDVGPQISPPDPPPWPPRYHVQQGHVVVVPLDPRQCSGVSLETLGRTWHCRADGRILIAAAYNDPVAQYDLVAPGTDEAHLLATISVAPGEYAHDTKPSSGRPVETARRRQERAVIAQALASGEEKYPELVLTGPFRAPLDDMRLSGDSYGLYREWIVRVGKGKKRHVTDQWTTRHEGIDEHAPTGTVVRAAGAGIIVYAAHASAEGKMVIIYHGSGVYSLSLHLSRMRVKTGDRVTPGQAIGASGATGLAHGPHLHYAIKVNGAYVDPEAFIETIDRDWK